MTFSIFIEVLLALLKFPAELSAFVKLIQKSPEQVRQEILLKIQAESDALDRGERPKWDV